MIKKRLFLQLKTVLLCCLLLALASACRRKEVKTQGGAVEKPWTTIAFRDGRHYEGEVNRPGDRVPDGFGVMFYGAGNTGYGNAGNGADSTASGSSGKVADSTYYGNFVKGRRNGIGRMAYADGTFVYGRWKDDALLPSDGRKYRWGDKVYGIDLSKHQPRIWWHMLTLYCDAYGDVFTGKAPETTFIQPVMFIILKSTEGATHHDRRYRHYVQIARRHRIVKGSYHFLTMTSDIQEQIDNYIAHTDYRRGDIPPILDIEIPEQWLTGDNLKLMQQYALTWLRAVEKHYKVTPVIYASENYRRKYLSGPEFSRYHFWVARYYGVEPANRDWKLWQFTDRGQVSGLHARHDVDINVFNGTYAEFRRWLGE